MEVCVCAALKMPDGYIVRGHRHDDCIMTAAFYKRYSKADLHQAEQGFLTTERRFVGRGEALALMRAHDPGFNVIGSILTSEDLY